MANRSNFVSSPVSPIDGKCLGHLSVDLDTASEAQRACRELNGRTVQGRKVFVHISRVPQHAAGRASFVPKALVRTTPSKQAVEIRTLTEKVSNLERAASERQIKLANAVAGIDSMIDVIYSLTTKVNELEKEAASTQERLATAEKVASTAEAAATDAQIMATQKLGAVKAAAADQMAALRRDLDARVAAAERAAFNEGTRVANLSPFQQQPQPQGNLSFDQWYLLAP